MSRSRRDATALVDVPQLPQTTRAGVPVARWVGRPLVVCVDGPLVGRWYFADDWQRQVDAGRAMVDRGGAVSSVYLEYEPLAGRRVPHPEQPTDGQSLHWHGTPRRRVR